MICSHCHRECEEGVTTCPHCGAGQYPRAEEMKYFRSDSEDLVLGVVLGLILFAFLGVGILVNPILWLLYRRRYRAFARGIGYVAFVPLVIILGGLVICGGGILFFSVRSGR